MSGVIEELPPVANAETIRAYRAFLRADSERAEPFDAYYSESVVRFELRETDTLAAPPDAVVDAAGCGTHIASVRANARLEVCGVDARKASAVFAAIDGVRSARDVRVASRVSTAAWRSLVRHCFGTVIFAPLAVAALEREVSGTELVRFPGSPYEIVRPYWENMSALRARLETSKEPEDARGFLRLLRDLHVLALCGENHASFYRPASPIALKGDAAPGGLLIEPAVTEELSTHVRFVSGPRVNATAIGGERYQVLLAESLGDHAAAGASRTPAEDVEWGRVVTARADTDAMSAEWFCPPRPLEWRHVEFIRRQFVDASRAASSGDASNAVRSVARLHWAFVRLHPFRFANQCLAMSFVNHVLRRARGAGIPHLVLDHIALRFSSSSYETVFRRAADVWIVSEPNPLHRLTELVARRTRAFGMLERIGAASSIAEARALLANRADAALVLLDARAPRQCGDDMG